MTMGAFENFDYNLAIGKEEKEKRARGKREVERKRARPKRNGKET